MAYNGKLQLFRGIPLDINSEDTFYFNSVASQNAYFNTLSLLTTVTFDAGDFKFIREGYVKVNRNHEYVESCNYLRYQNENLDSAYPTTDKKWYYAFITGIEYINDTTTGIYFKVDVLQTWLPNVDYNLNECYIERNHATTDEIGDNVATETLQAYKNKIYEENIISIKQRVYYVGVLFVEQNTFFGRLDIGITREGNYSYTTIFGTNKVDNTVSGANVVLFKVANTTGNINDDGLDNLRKALKQSATPLSQGAYIDEDKIISMFIIPSDLIDEEKLVEVKGTDGGTTAIWTGYTYPNRYCVTATSTWQDYYEQTKEKTITPTISTSAIGSYTPNNKKLLTSQFTSYEVINLDGNSARFEPEGFKNNGGNVVSPIFTIKTTMLPPNELIIMPKVGATMNYYGSIVPNEQMLGVGNMPSVSAKISTYEAWLVKQTVQKIQMLMPVSLVESSFAPASYVDPKLTLAREGLANQMKYSGGNFDVAEYVARNKQIHQLEVASQAKNQPHVDKTTDVNFSGLGSIVRTACGLMTMERPVPKSAGSVSDGGSVLNAHNMLDISIRKVAPIESELERIDDYFTAYGYAQYKLAVPHIKVRNRYTYVKTIGARMTPKSSGQTVITGIPSNYMLEINNRFDSGIRFWTGQDIGRLKDTSTSKNTILPSNQWDN